MSEFISLTEAAEMTSRYRQNRETILATNYQQQNVLPICEKFDRDQFETLLARQGCDALRIYYGMDENLKLHAVIVGVDANDEDMLPPSSITETEDEYIIERGIRCPPICPPESELNTDEP